jgi:alpha-galactosidase
VTENVTFTNEGSHSVNGVTLTLAVPSGWAVSPNSPVTVGTVEPGVSVSKSVQVIVPAPTQPFAVGTVTATASYRVAGVSDQTTSATGITVTGGPVSAPLKTYSSATDVPAEFSQIGDQLGVEGGGADVFSGSDDYSAIYQPSAVGTSSTVTTELTSEQDLTGFAKAGIMVRNDIAGAGSTPEGVLLFDSPSGGVQLEWDDNGGLYIDSVSPPNGTITATAPLYLRLVRSGDTYTGSWSTDGTTWQSVGSATVPDQATTQDAGVFVVSHTSGVPGVATFSGFNVS